MPSAAATAQLSNPVTVPAAVERPALGPPRSALRNTNMLSGPGAKIRSVAATANSSRAGCTRRW